MSKVFDAYAAYYDHYYARKEYATEARYVAGLLGNTRSGPLEILELGCGTGGHAEQLARLGHRVHGIDLSDRMLEFAGRRRDRLPADIAQRLSFEQGDLRTFRAGRNYDCVISLFHVFSYQTATADLVAAFRSAAAHLPAGGLAIVDYWHGPAVLSIKPEQRSQVVEDDQLRIVRTAHPQLLHEQNVVQVDYKVGVLDKGEDKTYSIDESHRMRYLFLPEIEHLCQPGFSVEQHLGWLKATPPGLDDWAAVSVLKKMP